MVYTTEAFSEIVRSRSVYRDGRGGRMSLPFVGTRWEACLGRQPRGFQLPDSKKTLAGNDLTEVQMFDVLGGLRKNESAGCYHPALSALTLPR